jgi:hypothetical protein
MQWIDRTGQENVGHANRGERRMAGAKGSDASEYDPDTNELVPLFNPRTDARTDDFQWSGPELRGKTKIGRATIDLLKGNLQERVEHRRILMDVGLLSSE